MNLAYDDFENLVGVRIINPEILKRIKIANVSIDSRKCSKNDLFIAIKGEKFNGHNYIKNVIKYGVRAVIVEKKWFSKYKIKSGNVSFILVNNTIEAMGELAAIYRSKFLIPVIAIAGSNGKTTTKDITANVLSQKYKVLNTEGNYNNSIGVPLTLFKLRDDHEICVLEIGTNHFGEIATLCKIAQPQFGLLTNIGKEHLEFLKDINGVKKEEFALIDYLKNNYGTLFLNLNDRYLSQLKPSNRLKTFSFCSKSKADVIGKIKKYDIFFPTISIEYWNKVFTTTLSMAGQQSFESALSAAAVGFFFEIPANKIKKSISGYKIVSKKRNELIKFNGIWVIDDTYNSNPDSVKIAVDNLKQYKTGGNKHIVLGDMLELGEKSKNEHKKIGQYIKKLGFNNLYTYGKDSYHTFVGAKGIKNNFYFNDKKTIGEFLKLSLKTEDIILIKGSRSMKMEEIIEILKEGIKI